VTTPPYDGQPHFPPGQPGQYQPQYPPAQYQPQGYNPYGQGGQGPQGYGYGYAPPGQLAGWPIRVGASILDSLLVSIPAITGAILSLVIDGDQDELGPGGGLAIGAGFLVAFLVWVWNRIIQQGRTGQSFGKKVTGLKVVHAQTGQLIGMGPNLGREICAQIFNELCILNVIWPLWDDKQQTWHDKVVGDIVIRT